MPTVRSDVRNFIGLTLFAVLLVSPLRAWATPIPRPCKLKRLNRHLAGQVIDHTHNHGKDLRIWSEALGEKRDLYVYLPPGFDPAKKYPLVIYLHGFNQEETGFTEDVVKPLDRAIACGILPPVIIAAPDGSPRGLTCLLTSGTFFFNSKMGRFEDFLMQDVWCFMHRHYPIRPEREAHAFLGVSMGGCSAFNMGIKYRDRVGIVIGVFPPLNLRWIDCHGNYWSDFDPCCWGWRTDFSRGHEVIGRFYGVINVRMRRLVHPLYGRNDPETAAKVSAENPIELLDSRDLRPGELQMFVAHAGRDEFNLKPQVESFLYRAHQRGLEVSVAYDPEGHHNERTALKLLPELLDWLGPRLAPYAPH
jgi:hypothetical protein